MQHHQNLNNNVYIPFNVYELQWQSLHMAAAAACRGSTTSGGSGCCENRVISRTNGLSCNDICGHHGTTCDAEVSLAGRRGQAKGPQIVGYYFNYGCGHKNNHPSSESEIKENYIWTSDFSGNGYISYCCCRIDK